MRIRVKYIEENSGVFVGTEKNLAPAIAKNLEKRGIVEIIGTGIPAEKNKAFVKKVDVKVDVVELTDSIDYSKLKKDELIKLAVKEGNELNGRETKSELIDLLK